MRDEIWIILLGIIFIVIGILFFKYYYKNSYSEDPKPVKIESILAFIVFFGITIIILSIISLIK